MFKNDKEWNYAKRIAKERNQTNNWIEVISYYNELGGEGVVIYVKPDNEGNAFMLIGSIDEHVDGDKKVILYDGDKQEVVIEDYLPVLEGQKEFHYLKNPKPHTAKLPKGVTFLEEQEIKFYM